MDVEKEITHLKEKKEGWKENEICDGGAKGPGRGDVGIVDHAEPVLQPGIRRQPGGNTFQVVSCHRKKRYHRGSWPKLRKNIAKERSVASRRGFPDDGRCLCHFASLWDCAMLLMVT